MLIIMKYLKRLGFLSVFFSIYVMGPCYLRELVYDILTFISLLLLTFCGVTIERAK